MAKVHSSPAPEPGDGAPEAASTDTPSSAGGIVRNLARTLLGQDRPGYQEYLGELATRMNGTFHDGGHAWGSQVEFSYKDASVRVHTGSTAVGRAPVSQTTVTVDFPEKLEFRMDVGPDGFIQKAAEHLFRIKDLFPGEGRFDAAVTVRGNPEDVVKEILSDPIIQEALIAQPGLMVSIITDKDSAANLFERHLGSTAADNRRQLVMRLGYAISDVDHLERLAKLACRFYDQIEKVTDARFPPD